MDYKTEKSTEKLEPPVFEIRIYGFNIRGLAEYLKLLNQGLWQRRSSFSAVLGPWKTEINSLCEVVYVAQYDSLTHLLDTRKKMLNDAEWDDYVTRISDLQMTFQNYLTVPVPGTELHRDFQPSVSAVYELQMIPESESRTVEHAEGTTVVGRFLSVYGPSKTEFCLLRYPDAKSAFTDAFHQRTALPPGASTRFMVPLQVSNMT